MMERRSRKSPEHPTKGRKREGLVRAKGWSRNKNEQGNSRKESGWHGCYGVLFGGVVGLMGHGKSGKAKRETRDKTPLDNFHTRVQQHSLPPMSGHCGRHKALYNSIPLTVFLGLGR